MRWLKQQLRQKMQARRLSLDPIQQRSLSLMIAQHCIKRPYFKFAQRIAFYHAFKGEISTQSILDQALLLDKRCFLPVLEGDVIKFVQVTNNTTYVQNRYGILEPTWDRSLILPATALDLVFVPLVAFDRQGNRLGRGGGLYDRTFAFRKHQNKPRLVGLAYDFQRTPHVPHTNLDILLDEVVTEKQIYVANQFKSPQP